MRILRVPVLAAGLMLLVIMGFADFAGAQGLELGPFRILPSLELSLEYDDNILLTPEDEIDDFIFHIMPGILIELPVEEVRHPARVPGGRPSLRGKHRPGHHPSRLAGQRARELQFRAGSSSHRSLHHHRRLLRIAGAGADAAGGAVGEHPRRRNGLHRARAPTRSTSAIAGSWWTTRTIRELNQFDRDDHTVAGTLFYRLFSKRRSSGKSTTTWSGTTFRRLRPRISDSDAWRFKLGIKGDITAKTTVLVKIGWEWRDYENRLREDWDGLIAEGQRHLEVPRALRGPAIRWPRERGIAVRGYELLRGHLRGRRGPALPQRAAGSCGSAGWVVSTSTPRTCWRAPRPPTGATGSSRRAPLSSTRCAAGWR